MLTFRIIVQGHGTMEVRWLQVVLILILLQGTGITGFSPFAVMSPAGVVPITLLDFAGKYKDKTIVLNWSTLTELNTRKFIH